METSVGPSAMISCKPRQARKGATVAVVSCAGVWLAEVPTIAFRRYRTVICFLRKNTY